MGKEITQRCPVNYADTLAVLEASVINNSTVGILCQHGQYTRKRSASLYRFTFDSFDAMGRNLAIRQKK